MIPAPETTPAAYDEAAAEIAALLRVPEPARLIEELKETAAACARSSSLTAGLGASFARQAANCLASASKATDDSVRAALLSTAHRCAWELAHLH
jgi:hypothetical protein